MTWFLYPTLLPTGNSGNTWHLLSCWSWASWQLTRTLECLLNVETFGNKELNLWPFNPEGDWVLLSNGVAKYSINANLQDSVAMVQHFINPFTVLIALSAGFPLWWYALENDRLMPKCWQYCWKRSETKFPPLAHLMLSGSPCSLNTDARVWMVQSVPSDDTGLTTKNLVEISSTIMKCWPWNSKLSRDKLLQGWVTVSETYGSCCCLLEKFRQGLQSLWLHQLCQVKTYKCVPFLKLY